MNKEKIVIKGFHKPKSTKITKKDISEMKKDEHGKKYKNEPKVIRRK